MIDLIISNTISAQITKNNLPREPLWDEDGACFKAELYETDPRGWRWKTMNLKAFQKGEPDKPLRAFFIPDSM